MTGEQIGGGNRQVAQDADTDRPLPIIGRGVFSRWAPRFMRGVGCLWDSNGIVTIQVSPDDGDNCRAVLRLTAAAAEDLAEELLRCARWSLGTRPDRRPWDRRWLT